MFAGIEVCNAQVKDFKVHDPSTILKFYSTYTLFSTGHGISVAYSDDLNTWNAGESVFTSNQWPTWINNYVPDFKGHFWAPECIYMNGKYYLYYSCSTFGSSTSAIGVVTNVTLDKNSKECKWVDLGMVVCSNARNQVNAIDPALFQDEAGKVYLTYGSFSNGIGIIEINPITGKPVDGALLHKVAGGNFADWEAGCLTRNGDSYYLFANRGFCCRKANSTYRIVAGRSNNPFGPFLDASGVDLNDGGGTEFLSTEGRYIGPGHVGILKSDGNSLVSIHYYDGLDEGKSKLDIVTLTYKAGWPQLTRINPARSSAITTDETINIVVEVSKSSTPVFTQKFPSAALGENSSYKVYNNKNQLITLRTSFKQGLLSLQGDLAEGNYMLEVVTKDGVKNLTPFTVSKDNQ